jgi:hypothetical protein
MGFLLTKRIASKRWFKLNAISALSGNGVMGWKCGSTANRNVGDTDMFNVEIRAIDDTWFVPHRGAYVCAEEAYALFGDLAALAFVARVREVEED